MATAVLTSKGQITVPKEVRDKLSLETGDRVEFVESEQGGFYIVPATRDVSTLKGIVPAPERPISAAAMNRAIAARAKKR